MMLLAWERVERNKEEINKINVFPVPDQDTGSNMAKTLLGIKEAIEVKEFQDLREISEATLDGALIAAQGNAGVIYTGFLAGFLPLLNKNPVNAKKLSVAFKKGAEKARESIQNPIEGTILDVIDAAAQTLQKEAGQERNIIQLFKKATEKANEALLATREKMEIFRKANVVDAGGLAFLMILEAHLEALEGEKRKERVEERPSEQVRRFIQTLSHRYEVVFLVKNQKLDKELLEKKLAILGNSIEVVKIGDKTKVHIHTDLVDEVEKIARESGKLESLRIEDMAKEVGGEPSVRQVSIGIVTDDVAGLLPKITERYQIEIVPTVLNWPEGKKIPGENIYQKMIEAKRRGIKSFPKTSQATPKDYLVAFEKQLHKFEKVLCITITAKLSGCYNSAKQAEAEVQEPKRIFVFDSWHASASQALLVLRAIELIQEQREIVEVINKLKKLRSKINLYLLFEEPRWIEAGGRVTKRQAEWIRRMKKIRLHPLIKIKNGVLIKGGVVWARDMADALFKKIAKESKKERERGKRIRVIISHANNLPEAKKLKDKLKSIKAEISFINLVSPVVGAHIGPGSLIAAWIPIE